MFGAEGGVAARQHALDAQSASGPSVSRMSRQIGDLPLPLDDHLLAGARHDDVGDAAIVEQDLQRPCATAAG